METNFWKDKKVLITGHNGFKGSWLCLWLNKLGAEVYGFSLPDPPTTPSLYELAKVNEVVKRSWGGSIDNYSSISECIKIVKPEIVFHMAAQTIVKEGFLKPLETFQTNIMGTAITLEACKQIKTIKSIVVVTTDKVYEDQQWPWGYRETDPLGANEPYSTSKACAELISACYRQDKLGNLPLATARAGNCIGFGDFAYRVIPMILEALGNNQIPPIWDPVAIRPWQDVLDCLSGYILLAEKLYNGPNPYLGSWNFGPYNEDSITVGDLTNLICKEWKKTEVSYNKVICPVSYNLGIDLYLDSSKARKLLGWESKWNIQKSIKNMVKIYKDYLDNKDIRTLVYNNIEEWQNDN